MSRNGGIGHGIDVGMSRAATPEVSVLLSFIIPAHNEEALIGRTLSALHQSVRPLAEPYEIIVADDASTDRTGAIARQHGARVVAVNRHQIAATRNAGRGRRPANGSSSWMRTRRRRRRRCGRPCAPCAAARWAAVVPCASTVPCRPMPRCWSVCCRRSCACSGWPPAVSSSARAGPTSPRADSTGAYAAEEVAFAGRLKRQGRFALLREFVFTSARKLRVRTALDLLRIGARLRWAARRRSGGARDWNTGTGRGRRRYLPLSLG